MLLSISAQLTDLPSFGGDATSGAAFGPAATGDLVTFAELLRRPAELRGSWPQALATAGTVPALPPGGNPLPPDTEAALLPPDLLPVPAVSIGADGMPADWPVDFRLSADAPTAAQPEGDPDAFFDGQPVALPVSEWHYRPTVRAGEPVATLRGVRAEASLPAAAHPEPSAAVSLEIELQAPATGSAELPELADATLMRGAAEAGPTTQAGVRGGPPPDAILAALGRDLGAAADRFEHPAVSLPAQPFNATAASAAGVAPLPSQAPASTVIALPMGEPAWADALGDQVLVLAGKQIQRAEIRVNPAELGPVQVRITVEEDGTTLAFTAQHAVTREAIEQALPRLRELFSDQGLSLLDTSVSEHGGRQEQDARLGRDEPGYLADGSIAGDADTVAPDRPVMAARNTLIDTFA